MLKSCDLAIGIETQYGQLVVSIQLTDSFIEITNHTNCSNKWSGIDYAMHYSMHLCHM